MTYHRDMEAQHAQGIAEGRLHPETREVLQDLWPDHRPAGLVGGQDRIVSRLPDFPHFSTVLIVPWHIVRIVV